MCTIIICGIQLNFWYFSGIFGQTNTTNSTSNDDAIFTRHVTQLRVEQEGEGEGEGEREVLEFQQDADH